MWDPLSYFCGSKVSLREAEVTLPRLAAPPPESLAAPAAGLSQSGQEPAGAAAALSREARAGPRRAPPRGRAGPRAGRRARQLARQAGCSAAPPRWPPAARRRLPSPAGEGGCLLPGRPWVSAPALHRPCPSSPRFPSGPVLAVTLGQSLGHSFRWLACRLPCITTMANSVSVFSSSVKE